MYLHDQKPALRLKMVWSIGGVYYDGAVYADDGFGNFIKTGWVASSRFLSFNKGA
ncbi:hypothetical protein UFOVP814_40 [uncultured Caudovirales phage]|uniref:Uncharacterized protein n=1 Tax=uncultured Caudovirales phage TaxID=2100421 RepID=A0A6J5NX72_9CAUD|nr:hypothetical protein UFOVP814_40 [uncultured Caudovirales phage]